MTYIYIIRSLCAWSLLQQALTTIWNIFKCLTVILLGDFSFYLNIKMAWGRIASYLRVVILYHELFCCELISLDCALFFYLTGRNVILKFLIVWYFYYEYFMKSSNTSSRWLHLVVFAALDGNGKRRSFSGTWFSYFGKIVLTLNINFHWWNWFLRLK